MDGEKGIDGMETKGWMDGEKGWKGFPSPALPKEENSHRMRGSPLLFVLPVPAFSCLSFPAPLSQLEQSDDVTREGFTA